MFANLHSDLRINGDYYRNDPERRLAPGSSCFWYSILIQDDEGDGRIRQFSFIVDDQHAVYGVLLVEFVQIDVGP
ncbi:MAG: hypothetical protein L0Y72_07425 [Gemmataceae bacterium]|nr:hypothetical protein [Gemmataceae bacterium]MCI0738858.1 hypothetical protein [Gemmataceae bacterium]